MQMSCFLIHVVCARVHDSCPSASLLSAMIVGYVSLLILCTVVSMMATGGVLLFGPYEYEVSRVSRCNEITRSKRCLKGTPDVPLLHASPV